MWEPNKPIQVTDPEGFFSAINMTVAQQDKAHIVLVFNMTFAKPMDTSDLIVRHWNTKYNVPHDDRLPNYLLVTPVLSPPIVPPPAPTYSVPFWIKNDAGWWAKGKVSDNEFVGTIQYLIGQGIVKVPELKNWSSSPQPIPDWIKINAQWWSDGKISDYDFVQGIQYLVTNGIIKGQ